MPKINVLPKSVAELIAAGEVVERPSSAVKEMIENSIDAGASAVTVEIKNGGIRYIRITDNGCGIHREDVRTAFISHATSKISRGEDLDAIFTLGFRGEALPSIAAVSRLSMLTKPTDADVGTSIEIHGGEEISFDDAGCPDGTTVIVRDLFYNTPARMKFLKKDMTEGTYISDVVAKAAVSHPEIKFTLIKDGKQTLSTTGNGDLLSAVYSVFGKEISDSLILVDYEYNSVKVHGFISKPLNNRPNRNMQYFYVNGRYVRMPVASAALDEAYKNSIMVGKFPVCFLFVDIPAGKIDVNVHPAKTEIRFSEDSKIFEAVFYSAKSALNKGDSARPGVTLKEKRDITAKTAPVSVQMKFTEPYVITDKAEEKDEIRKVNTVTKDIVKSELRSEPVITRKKADINISADDSGDKKPESSVFSVKKAEEEKTEVIKPFSVPVAYEKEVFRSTSSVFENITPKEVIDQKNKGFFNAPIINEAPVTSPKALPDKEKNVSDENFTVLGEIFRTYILVECGDKLFIIDKHAAHERMIFNKLSKTDFTKDSQLLLAPVTVTLSGNEYAQVLENIDVFAKGGFMVDDFGDGAVIIRGFPLVLTKEDIPSIITEIAGELVKGKSKPVPEKLTWLYHSASCRAAIKAGDSLKKEEIEAFVRKLLSDESIRYCPHGRPVMYELSKHEIEKQFGRV